MSDSSNSFHELLSAACEDRLTPEQAQRLDHLLRTDAEARKEYLQVVHMEATLHALLRPPEQAALPPMPSLHDAMILPAMDAEEEVAEPEMPVLPPLEMPRRVEEPAPVRGRRWWVYAGAGIAAAVAVMVLVMNFGKKPVVQGPAAVLAGTIKAEWKAEPQAPRESEAIAPETHVLVSGLASIQFGNGATVVVEGPATFRVTSSSQLELTEGQMTARVPPPAVGFAVHTPHAVITDLGTEFGVRVDPAQQTHAEVFVGKVTAAGMENAGATGGMAPQVLEAGHAVQIDSKGVMAEASPEPLAYVRPAEFAQRMQQPDGGDAAYGRWLERSKALRADPSVVAYFTFDHELDAGPASEYTMQAAEDAGRFNGKRAARFSDSSRVIFSRTGKFPQLTLMAWVNFDDLANAYTSIVSDDVKTDANFHWDVYHHSNTATMEFGTPRGGTNGAWEKRQFDAKVLTTKMKSWHFLAVSYDSTNSRIYGYVDGKRVGEQAIPFPVALEIGTAQIGNWTPTNSAAGSRGLHGRVDELAIMKRILSEEEIRSIYEAGAP